MSTEGNHCIFPCLGGERLGWGWPWSPLGLVVETKGSASAGRRMSPERTDQARADPIRNGPSVECWAGPVISKPPMAIGKEARRSRSIILSIWESLLSHARREPQACSCGSLLISQMKHILFLFELANKNVLYKVNTSS